MTWLGCVSRSRLLMSASRILFLSAMATGLLSLASFLPQNMPDSIQITFAASPCTSADPWTTLLPSEYYTLPQWFLNTNPTVIWVQPADVMYDDKTGASSPANNPTLAPIKTKAGSTGLYCDWLLVEGGTPPYTYSGSNLPPGLTVSTSGLYGGTAYKPGIYTGILFCATDSLGVKICAVPRTQQVCDGGLTACSL